MRQINHTQAERRKQRKMVEVLVSDFVVPIAETPRHSLWLSNLDVVAARGHTPLVYLYGPNSNPDFFSVGVVKSALAKALVPFYPLAGRLGLDRTGRVEINCSAEGVLFVAARSEKSLEKLREFVPSTEMREMFVPSVESAEPPCVLLMIQWLIDCIDDASDDFYCRRRKQLAFDSDGRQVLDR